MSEEAAPKRRGPANMTDDHKAALAEGRNESRAVKVYLEALAANKPKRGRKRTPDSIKKRIAVINEEMDSSGPLQQVQMIQERMDLAAELERMSETVDLTELEAGFVAVAASYSNRKGISYQAWREFGVPPAVLKQAKVSRGS